MVVRRDRSLGGKEVVVARRAESPKALSSPLSSAKDGVLGGSATERVSLRKKRLPKWWPSLEQNEDSFYLSMVDNQDYQRDADRLIRGSLLLLGISFFFSFKKYMFIYINVCINFLENHG